MRNESESSKPSHATAFSGVTDGRRRNMQANRSKETKPELLDRTKLKTIFDSMRWHDSTTSGEGPKQLVKHTATSSADGHLRTADRAPSPRCGRTSSISLLSASNVSLSIRSWYARAGRVQGTLRD